MSTILSNLFKSKQEFSPRSLHVFNSIDTVLNASSEKLKELKEKGYTVLPFLSEEEVAVLNQKLDVFLQSFERPIGELFYTSGRDEVEQRTLAKQLTWSLIEPLLERIIHPDKTTSEGCAWLLKPQGDTSALSPHQDSSLIDETNFASFYGWIPIQHTQIENGCMHVIPGSHLWGNNYRSLDVPWAFQDFSEILLKYSKPIEMHAGEILLFDSALIHGSFPNKTKKIRAALNLFFRPKDTYMVHYAKFEDSPKNKIEAYKITSDFFLNEDFRKRPDSEKYPFIGHVSHLQPKISAKSIDKMYAHSLPK